MRFVKPSVEFITDLKELDPKIIADAGRTSYKSHKANATREDAENFIRKLITNGHESVLEHLSFTVKFVTDRITANCLVRHRLASFTQESTRYCNYSKDKFGNEISCLYPKTLKDKGCEEALTAVYDAYVAAEDAYLKLLGMGVATQEARCVLPLGLKTELVMTANIREWRHILKLRTDSAAHPDVRYLCNQILDELNKYHPYFVFDLIKDEECLADAA